MILVLNLASAGFEASFDFNCFTSRSRSALRCCNCRTASSKFFNRSASDWPTESAGQIGRQMREERRKIATAKTTRIFILRNPSECYIFLIKRTSRACKDKIRELSKKILLPVAAEIGGSLTILASSLVAFRGENRFRIGTRNFAYRDPADS